jgi:hypothetical protein
VWGDLEPPSLEEMFLLKIQEIITYTNITNCTEPADIGAKAVIDAETGEWVDWVWQEVG